MIVQGIPSLVQSFFFTNKTSKHKEKYNLDYRYYGLRKIVLELCRRSLRTRFIVSGQENLPKGQVLFVANHVSYMDPLSFIAVSDRPVAFLSKKEAIKLPVIGNANIGLGGKFLDREDLRSEIKVFKEVEDEMEKEKELSFVIFPEGTRETPPDFKMLPFHHGSFKPAERLGLPVVPVAIYLSDRVLNPNYHYKTYPIQIRFLRPFLPEECEKMTTKELALESHNLILKNLEEMIVLDRKYVKELNGYTDEETDKVLRSTETRKH